MSDLRTQLTSIYRDRGELTPQNVVDVARPDDHPLHSRFEWDNELAGEAYRRVQAAELIRSVKVIYSESPKGEPKSVRAFSSLREASDTPEASGYAPTEDIVADDFSRQLLLRQCKREIDQLRTKYGHLQEFATMMTQAVAS